MNPVAGRDPPAEFYFFPGLPSRIKLLNLNAAGHVQASQTSESALQESGALFLFLVVPAAAELHLCAVDGQFL
ncbi:MAG: hypothetical protein ABSB15_27050, partial [Bryobacteraceae bacterium]